MEGRTTNSKVNSIGGEFHFEFFDQLLDELAPAEAVELVRVLRITTPQVSDEGGRNAITEEKKQRDTNELQ
jgi:hypothetical protein